ncbi:MAG TPA: hypothetical protein VJ063_01080 [Verrucomicrobiae bacterium]|nr:hypothetical protein [Verrucomicrobiae bacterium]
MKTALLVVLAAAVGFAAGFVIISKRHAARHAALLAEQRAAWENEKAVLEQELDAARARMPALASVTVPASVTGDAVPARPGPAEILGKLQALRGRGPRQLREAAYWLTELTQRGTAALPAIRDFLARNQDIDFDTASFTQNKSVREVPLDFALPPSLRFGLFDVVRQIGGTDAERILAEALGRTGRGVEILYLTRALQEMAPNNYRDAALSVARELLAANTSPAFSSPLDRNHRDNLFSVLSMYNDGSFTGNAQAQLVQADGQIDRGALKYLQQVLGPQSVAIAAQAYQDPRVSDSAKKEPLARVALSYVGADQQANEFYQRAINDPVLTPNHRKNLIEDLNEDGLNFKNLTQQDLPLIKNRLTLIDQLAPNAMDKANAAAFQEAKKDLLNMLLRLGGP